MSGTELGGFLGRVATADPSMLEPYSRTGFAAGNAVDGSRSNTEHNAVRKTCPLAGSVVGEIVAELDE